MRLLNRIAMLILLAALAALLSAALSLFIADNLCRGTDCALKALVYGGVAIWIGLVGLFCAVLWWRGRF